MSIYSFSDSDNTKKCGLSRTVSPLAIETGSNRLAGAVVPPAMVPSTINLSFEKSLFQNFTFRSASASPATPAGERRFRRPLRGSSHLKRALDVVVASTLLVLLLPFLLILAALVRVSGPGPIIFRQERIGAQRKPFVLLKFRTMENSSGFAQATIGDPRVTAIGRVLRRLSFDEIVQLVNVLKGEMSLVGPRPHAQETRVEGILFEQAVPSYRERYATKPGITGLAQIRGQRGGTRTIQQLEERVASDIEYIENWSIWLDLSILLKTIPAILKPVNAY